MKGAQKELLTTSEVAELFRVGPKTVLCWVKDGKLPCVRTMGGHHRFPRPEIEKLLKSQGR